MNQNNMYNSIQQRTNDLCLRNLDVEYYPLESRLANTLENCQKKDFVEFCYLQSVETECHFLINCPFYNDIRTNIFKNILVTCLYPVRQRSTIKLFDAESSQECNQIPYLRNFPQKTNNLCCVNIYILHYKPELYFLLTL